jgi:hypothetical protein
MRVFISHISEEAAIAAVLKDWIESTFLGHVGVFVSSDPADIPAGSKWLDEVSSALEEAAVLICLFSAASSNRPWISFEAGCAWMKKVPIIPVCHSGLSVVQLRQPLASLKALDMSDAKFGEKLFSALGRQLNVSKLPRIPFSEFEAEMRAAAADTSAKALRPTHIMHGADGPEPRLIEIHYKILKRLAELNDAGHQSINAPQLAQLVDVRPTMLSHHIKPLVSGDFVHDHLRVGGPLAYSIAARGIDLLVRKHIIK